MQQDYGGMQQYVEWANSTGTVSQFYTDSSIQALYKDYVTGIVLRKNSLTGVVYRDDPAILAWDIANEPSNYGDDSGDVLQVCCWRCAVSEPYVECASGMYSICHTQLLPCTAPGYYAQHRCYVQCLMHHVAWDSLLTAQLQDQNH